MEIKPFNALRFDSSVVGDIGNCIAPPYDVIDPDMQQQLYDRSRYNIVRIIKGKTSPTDTAEDNKYTRAGRFLDDWLKTAALKPDACSAIYAYVQNFAIGSEHFQRSGFVALGKLAEFGHGVQPHERTLDGPKADRLDLMRATATQFGQIFMLYDDPEKIADTLISKSAVRSSLIDFTDDDDVRHRLFAIDNPDDIKTIAEMMAIKQAVIADGHHRYETALNYYAETQNPAAQYRMMTFVNMRNEGLIILPTHRLVGNVPDFDIDKTVAGIEDNFDVTEYSFTGPADKALAGTKMFDRMKSDFKSNRNTFGIYAGGSVFYLAVLRDIASMEPVAPQMSQAARALDVNVLHTLILEKVLGIGEKELASQSNIEYIKDIGNAIGRSVERVDSGGSQAVFFMNPTRIGQVKAIAAAGEKMPQKSTFFYPKVFTGLVINKL